MKTILSSRRDCYLAKFSIFLLTVALIAGMVGCNEPTDYDLTISSSAGGNVTATVNEKEYVIEPDKEDTIFGIANSTPVNLVATPKPGWRFDKWTGDVDTIADVNAAATTITMNGRYDIFDYHITAEFIEGLEIQSWKDLDAIRDDLSGHHILMKDLDSTMDDLDDYKDLASPTADEGKGWEPIETFRGSFNGQGHEIRDLFINRPGKTGVGLFGYVGEDGFVKNVTVVNANVTGNGRVGGLVGSNRGTVTSSNSTGNVKGNDKVGGLVGWNGGDVLDSHSSGNVTGSNMYVGGLVGWNQGTVENSHSTGNVTGSNMYVGGLVGYNKGGTVTNSYSTGNVTGSYDYVGGLVGWNQDTVSSSNFTGSVTGSYDYVGGLVGWNQGTVENSHSSGNVTGSNMYVGGLVGYNKGGSVTKSYSTSNVTGSNKCVGGLVGWNGGTVSHSHSSSNVTGSDEHVGGLVGWNEGTVEEKSYSTGNVKGNDKVGGLVGFNNQYGRVSKSHSTGSVTSEEGSDIGGLVGWNEGKVEDSYSSSGVIGRLHVGGLVGENINTVERSYSTGNVTGDTYVGGLVGQNDDTVKKSYSTGIVTGSKRVGGLVGYNFRGSAVSDSYSRANVSGSNQYVGGLVGYNEQSLVNMCYSTGEVTGGRDVGGLVGENNNGDVLNSFWDTQTSGHPTRSDGGTGKNTTAMKQIKTYTETEPGVLDEEWNIYDVDPGLTNPAYIWNIVDGRDYPFLSWQ